MSTATMRGKITGQDYGSFSTRNLHRTRLISAERDGDFGKIADTRFHVPAGHGARVVLPAETPCEPQL